MATRLDALLSHRGHGSRSVVRKLIRSGRVTVDAEVCRDPSQHIGPDTAVHVDGEAPPPTPVDVPFVVHKPVGVTCRLRAEGRRVLDLVPSSFRRDGVEPVPRLDDVASGLIIVTGEGAFAQRIVGPARRVPKRYRVRYEGEFPADGVERCAAGIQLPDRSRPLRPCHWEPGSEADGLGSATLTRFETGAEQIPGILATLGLRLVSLHRDRIGALDLPGDLAEGGARPLTPTERSAVTARA